MSPHKCVIHSLLVIINEFFAFTREYPNYLIVCVDWGTSYKHKTMAAPTLEAVLLNTLNKDEQVRKNAEQALNEACGHSGYTVSLLRVACDAQSPKEVRQAASVALKNGIKRNWTTEEEELQQQQSQQHDVLAGKYSIPKEDRDLVR